MHRRGGGKNRTTLFLDIDNKKGTGNFYARLLRKIRGRGGERVSPPLSVYCITFRYVALSYDGLTLICPRFTIR